MRLGGARGAVALLAPLALVACASERSASSEKEAEQSTPDEEAAQGSSRYGQLQEVPAEFLGRWQLAHQVCEPDSEEVPDTDLPDVVLSFLPDHSYEMVVEGWLGRGTFKVEAFVDDTRLTLEDTSLNFDAVDGKLENWSEGDAVYPCGNVFERAD